MFKYGVKFNDGEIYWLDSFEDAMKTIKKEIDYFLLGAQEGIFYPPYLLPHIVPEYLGCKKIE